MVEQRQIAVGRMTGPAGQRPIVAAYAMTPKEIFGMLRRHILLIVSLTILGLIISGVAWYLLRKYAPKYTAQTFIKVLPPVEKDPMTIGAAMVGRDIQYGYRLSLAALINQQSTLQKLIVRDKIQETEWFKSFGDIERERHKCITKAFRDLSKRFGAYAQREGDYIVVSMTCSEKEEAALIVNEMVDLFLASQGSAKRKEVAARLVKLEERRVRVQSDLEYTEQTLADVRKASGFADLEERNFQHTITLRLNDLEIERNELILDITQIQTAIENLERLATGPIAEQVGREVEKDPIMLSLGQQLTSLEIALASKLEKFGENHRVVREIQELISATKEKRQIRKTEIADQTRWSNLKNAQDSLVVLQSKLEELTKMREEAAAKKIELDFARVQYEQRVSIRDERKQMLGLIKEQIEKMRMVREDPETPKVQFMGHAPVPLDVSSPRWRVYFPAGTTLGFVFGIGLALLIELLNDLVRTPRDVVRYLHIPLLGVIPDAAEDEQLQDVDLCHVVRQAPYSIVSESYRRFRTNLKLSDSAEALKVLLVTSGVTGDGKTSVAVNLATTFIAEDKKVLLIDANFRRPSLQIVFPKPAAEDEAVEQPGFGLSSLLMGLCSYEDAKRSDVVEGLDIIDSGPLPSNPAELLGSHRMEQMIKDRRKSYDYVIIDTPPVLLVSDAKVLAGFADGAVLVFNAAATTKGAAQRTIRELIEVNTTIVGCVLFAVKAMKGGYFQEQLKAYQEYQKLQLARAV